LVKTILEQRSGKDIENDITSPTVTEPKDIEEKLSTTIENLPSEKVEEVIIDDVEDSIVTSEPNIISDTVTDIEEKKDIKPDTQIEENIKQYKYPISKYENDKIRSDQFSRELEEIYCKYIDIILKCSKKYDLEPELVIAIGSRESGWGYFLKPVRDPAGTGDARPRKNKTRFRSGSLPPDGFGFGRGLMQIDFDAHEFARGSDWKDPEKNVCYGCSVLRSFTNYINKSFPNLTESEKIRAGIASYNCGPGNVAKALSNNIDVDSYTTGRDYSKDVLERMYWFHRRLESG